MKRIINLLVIITIISGCVSEPHYTIEGRIEGIDNETVLLMKRDGKNYILVDSLTTESGLFKMTGKTEFPEQHYLEVIGHNGVLNFFLENSDISIIAHIDSIPNAKVSGSDTNVEYDNYNKLLAQFYSKQVDLGIKYSAAEKEGNNTLMQELYNEYLKVEDEIKAFNKEFVVTHGSSYIVPPIIRSISVNMGADEIEELINALDDNIAETSIIKIIRIRIESLRNTTIGSIAPDFVSKDINGNPINFHDKIGSKLLLLDFWASWCSPCRRANPNIVKLYNEFHIKGFDVFGVSLDKTKNDWINAISVDKLPWTQVADLKYWDCDAVTKYGVVAVPTNFLIDENGVIIAKDLKGEELYEKVKIILAKK